MAAYDGASPRRRAPASRAPPCAFHWTSQGCKPKAGGAPHTFSHLPYAASFVHHLHCSPLPWSDVLSASPTFNPRLCLCSDSLPSSPPLYVVVLPLSVLTFSQAFSAGTRGPQFAAVARLCRLDLRVSHVPSRSAANTRWWHIGGRGRAEEVDRLIECCTFLVERVMDGQAAPERMAEELCAHMAGFDERRGRAGHSFHSLQSRGLHLPSSLPLPIAPPRPPEAEVKSGLFHPAPEPNPAPPPSHTPPRPAHPMSHEPYRLSFARALDRSPRTWESLAKQGTAFLAALCREAPSASSPTTDSLLAVVSVPVAQYDLVRGVGQRYVECVQRLSGVAAVSLEREVVEEGDVSEEEAPLWVYLRAHSPHAEAIDALLECAFHTLEKAAEWEAVLEEERVRLLERHIAAYLHRRYAARWLPSDALFCIRPDELRSAWTAVSTPAVDAFSAPPSVSALSPPSHSASAAAADGEPCPLQWSPGGCPPHSQCPHVHLPYRDAFLRHVERGVVVWRDLWNTSDRFRPLLRAGSQCIALLPIPALHLPAAVIRRLPVYSAIRQLCALPKKQDLWLVEQGGVESHSWTALKGRGEAWQVDSLLECAFFLYAHPDAGGWTNAELLSRLSAHITAFQHRRGRSSHDFLSLHPEGSTQPREVTPAVPVPLSSQSPRGSRSSSPAVTGRGVVCMAQFDGGGCSQPHCAGAHGSYAELLAARLDRSYAPLSSMPGSTPTFHPILALVPSSHDSRARYVLSLPLPRIPHLLSMLASHPILDCLKECSGVKAIDTSVQLSIDNVIERPSVDWLNLRAEAGQNHLDVLMEGVVWIVEGRLNRCPSDGRVEALRRHLTAFNRRADAARPGPGEFLSLSTRLPADGVAHRRSPHTGVVRRASEATGERRERRSRVSPSLSPRAAASLVSPQSSVSSSLPSSSGGSYEVPMPWVAPPLSSPLPPPLPPMVLPVLEPCMANLHPRRCPASDCPYSHLPYVDLFASRCDTRPIRAADIPPITPSFHPVLARIPLLPGEPPSSSPRYVVSLPLPRIPRVLSQLMGTDDRMLSFLAQMSGVSGLKGPHRREYAPYSLGDPSVDWLPLTAEGDKEQVDTLMETMLFLLEEQRDLPLATDLEEHQRLHSGLVERVREHVAGVLEGLRRGEGGVGADDFFALQSRGAPALPSLPSPPHSPSPLPTLEAISATSRPLDLSSWYAAGAAVTVSSALLVDDSSPAPTPYLRCLPHTSFAVLPIEWDAEVRDVFSYDVVAGQLKLSEVEAAWQVDIFVPRMEGKDGGVDGGQQTSAQTTTAYEGHREMQRPQRWLNATVWRNHEAGGRGRPGEAEVGGGGAGAGAAL